MRPRCIDPPVPKKIFATLAFTPLDATGVPMRTLRADRLPTAALEAAALGQVDGIRTIADIAAKLGLSDVEVASLIARLVDVGCVTIGASAPEDDADARPTLPSAPPVSARRTSGTRRLVRAVAPGRARSS